MKKALRTFVLYVICAIAGALVAHFAIEWHEGTLGHGAAETHE